MANLGGAHFMTKRKSLNLKLHQFMRIVRSNIFPKNELLIYKHIIRPVMNMIFNFGVHPNYQV